MDDAAAGIARYDIILPISVEHLGWRHRKEGHLSSTCQRRLGSSCGGDFLHLQDGGMNEGCPWVRGAFCIPGRCLRRFPVTCPHIPLVHQGPYRFAGDRLECYVNSVPLLHPALTFLRIFHTPQSTVLILSAQVALALCPGITSLLGRLSRCCWPLKRRHVWLQSWRLLVRLERLICE